WRVRAASRPRPRWPLHSSPCGTPASPRGSTAAYRPRRSSTGRTPLRGAASSRRSGTSRGR
ncbi:MAG: integrase family protein, partial [uncultured Pseudonocardia sp.]